MRFARLKHYGYLLFPVIVALILFRRSFRIWFLKDDFAWLGLRLSVASFPDLVEALFAPMAQGTIRVLSERAFFLGFESVFGLESLPMRVWMFLTLAVAIVLLTLVTERLSGNRWVGLAAALFWTLNFGVSVAMCWLSSYNQILISALMLGAMLALIEGRVGWCWACYLLGFGALENVIMLPAVLLLWAWLYDRAKMRVVWPMFAPAMAFAGAHLFLIPKTQSDPSYKMHFDLAIFDTLGVYWRWMLGAVRLSNFSPDYLWMEWPALLGGTTALAASLYFGWRRKMWAPLFGLGFSLAAIAPMLPLRDHQTDYYLASASMGIMMALASLIPLTPVALRWALVLCLGAYVYPSYLLQRNIFEWYLEATGPVRVIVRGAIQASRLHPDRLILLDGISPQLYGNTIADDGLRLIANGRLRLAPSNGPAGSPWTLSPEATRAGLEKNLLRIYRLEGPVLRDVTRDWEQNRGPELAGGFSPQVSAGEKTFQTQFGEGWYGIENGTRWMGREARLRLGGGPLRAGAVFFVKGYVPPSLGAAKLAVTINGIECGVIDAPPGELLAELPLPEAVAKESVYEVRLKASKTVRPPKDGRDLSFVFGELGVR